MPLKQFNKPGRFANGKTINYPELYSAGIYKVEPNGTIRDDIQEGTFLLNPATWEEDKTSNWVPQPVPGQSDPIWQWISGGPRTVSFEALVTNDTSYLSVGSKITSQQQTSSTTNAVNFIGSIASQFFKITAPVTPLTTTGQNIMPDPLDISNRLNYYRSLEYPTYSTTNSGNQTLNQSPPLVVLYVGNTLSNINLGSAITTNSDTWVVTNLRIRITKQTPNLSPMEALVQFTLAQYNIRSFSSDRFTKIQNNNNNISGSGNSGIPGAL